VVAVEETEDGEWQVRFYDLPIGVIDAEKRKLRRPARQSSSPPRAPS